MYFRAIVQHLEQCIEGSNIHTSGRQTDVERMFIASCAASELKLSDGSNEIEARLSYRPARPWRMLSAVVGGGACKTGGGIASGDPVR